MFEFDDVLMHDSADNVWSFLFGDGAVALPVGSHTAYQRNDLGMGVWALQRNEVSLPEQPLSDLSASEILELSSLLNPSV